MKKIIVAIFCLWVLLSNANAKSVRAYFSYASFQGLNNKTYIETYLSFVAHTLHPELTAQKTYKTSVKVGMLILKDDQIVYANKYNVNGPEQKDTLALLEFIDQQRIALEPGTYKLELELADNYLVNAPVTKATQEIIVKNYNDTINFSDVELIESYIETKAPSIATKSGFDLIPYVSTYFPEKIKNLSYYVELYNTNKYWGSDDKVLIRTSIESYERGIKLNNYNSFKKYTTQPIISLIGEFNIEQLPSGNYNLAFEVISNQNKVVARRKLFFQRVNKKAIVVEADLASVNVAKTFVENIANVDSLDECIRCLRPTATASELDFIDRPIKEYPKEIKQQFLLSFWQRRNQENPEEEFLKYMANVKLVNEKYSSKIKKGYSTDRGRVYLKYGKPDQLTKVDFEPSNYPYEIWQYYSLSKTQVNQRNNRKFLFYNPDIVTNDYRLLHSDAIGEVRNDRWQIMLAKRNTKVTNIDETKSADSYGNRAAEFFENPR